MTDKDRLREAMTGVRDALDWYRSAGGAVSYDDLHAMIRAALKSADTVRDLLVSETLPQCQPEPIDNNF